MLLLWTPLDVFDAVLVALQAALGFLDKLGAIRVDWSVDPQLSVTTAGGKSAAVQRTPLDGETFSLVPELPNLRPSIALLRYVLLLFLLASGCRCL